MTFDFSVFDGPSGTYTVSVNELMRLPILELESIKPYLIKKQMEEPVEIDVRTENQIVYITWYPRTEGH